MMLNKTWTYVEFDLLNQQTHHIGVAIQGFVLLTFPRLPSHSSSRLLKTKDDFFPMCPVILGRDPVANILYVWTDKRCGEPAAGNLYAMDLQSGKERPTPTPPPPFFSADPRPDRPPDQERRVRDAGVRRHVRSVRLEVRRRPVGAASVPCFE